MKWIKLSESSYPKFGQRVFLLRRKAGLEDHYSIGQLTHIERGETFRFDTDLSSEEGDDFTHYAVPQPPKQ